MRTRSLLGGAAAVSVTAAAALVPLLGAAPAQAAVCSGTTGVSVVVDYNELGDGVRTGCDSDGGGKRASEIIPGAGFPLEYAASSAGFVCRVTGSPASDPCIEAAPPDKYWSLWWSDGTSGTWSYASRGTQALRVPNGGYVAFAWHEGSGRAAPPDVAPTVRTATPPKPTSSPKPEKPKPAPTKKPDAAPSSRPSSTPTPTPRATTAPAESATPQASESATEAPTAEESASVSPDPADPTATVAPGAPAADDVTAGPPADGVVDSAEQESDGGLPLWVPIGAVLVVAAAGGVFAWRRRLG